MTVPNASRAVRRHQNADRRPDVDELGVIDDGPGRDPGSPEDGRRDRGIPELERCQPAVGLTHGRRQRQKRSFQEPELGQPLDEFTEQPVAVVRFLR